jgi:hypothetical protein
MSRLIPGPPHRVNPIGAYDIYKRAKGLTRPFPPSPDRGLDDPSGYIFNAQDGSYTMIDEK